MSWFLIVLALALASAGGYHLGRGRRDMAAGARGVSADTEHMLDLLRRAHGALAAVALDEAGAVFAARDSREGSAEDVGRGRALARVALADGRRHHLDDPTSAIAASHAGIAVALVFAGPVLPDATERAQADAWRLSAGLAEQRAQIGRQTLQPDRASLEAVQISETVDSAASALCRTVSLSFDRESALVLRDEFSSVLKVVRVSRGADRRLEGVSALPGSAVARAIEANAPVAARSAEELFGHPRSDRRRGTDAGLAFPLRDGTRAMGALVVFGAPEHFDPYERDEIERILGAAGPRVARFHAVEAQEARARTDELTGLPNRRGLDHAMALAGERAGLLIVDLDHFKRVNDTYGHVAGDAALRHVASLLRRVLRAPDLASRMGGEEFGLWLPEASLATALEVAERVRVTLEGTPFWWHGSEVRLTCSVGVATVPETTAVIANLYPAADAALYRAKEHGRNRVEVAAAAAPKARES